MTITKELLENKWPIIRHGVASCSSYIDTVETLIETDFFLSFYQIELYSLKANLISSISCQKIELHNEYN